MVFNSNRIFIGILLLIIVSISFFFKLENILVFIMIFFISYDLFYNKILNYNILILILLITFVTLIFIPFYMFQYLFILIIPLIFMTIFLDRLKNILFVFSLYLFSLILFYIALVDRNIFYTIIFLSFINDTFAYFIGRYLRGPLILPKISPKKTWSGTSASFFLSFIILIYLNYEILLSLFIAISLFLGDIYFSYMKRYLNIKDYSSLLGDHGGILDRVDSMFLISIIFQIYLVILIWKLKLL